MLSYAQDATSIGCKTDLTKEVLRTGRAQLFSVLIIFLASQASHHHAQLRAPRSLRRHADRFAGAAQGGWRRASAMMLWRCARRRELPCAPAFRRAPADATRPRATRAQMSPRAAPRRHCTARCGALAWPALKSTVSGGGWFIDRVGDWRGIFFPGGSLQY